MSGVLVVQKKKRKVAKRDAIAGLVIVLLNFFNTRVFVVSRVSRDRGTDVTSTAAR